MKYDTARTISGKEVEQFINLTEKDISKSYIMGLFGRFKGKRKYNQYDYLVIPPDSYGPKGKRNKNEFTTTIGIFIFNKFFIEEYLFDVFKYINKEINGDVFEDINKAMSYAVLEDTITVDDLMMFLNKSQFFMRFVSVLSSNYSDKMLLVYSHLKKRKEQLLKENKEAIDNGDEIVSEKIEKELLDMAKEYLKGDPAMEIYDSKSRGKWGNNFKTMFVMKGATMNPDPTKGFDIITSNYVEGISPKDFTAMANGIPGGAYARAKNTAVGGYWVKLFMRSFQHLMLLDKDSDCGTKRTIQVKLTEKNIDLYMYLYVANKDGSLTLIDSKNRNSFINKTVNLRFPTECESKDGICNKCAGELFYKIGIKKIGMATSKPASQLMQFSLKKFHDSTISTHEIDLGKAFKDLF